MDRYKVWYYLENTSWYEGCYDEVGNQLTYKDSSGYWSERTYDASGNEITFKGGKI